MRKWLLLCGMVLILTGCWDRYELEDRANILGLAVDLADEEDLKNEPEVTHFPDFFKEKKRDTLYKVTAQMAVPGKIKLGPEGGSGEGSEKTAWILETYGHTMMDAIANLQQQLAEKLYLGHLQVVVVSDEIAKRGLSEINDFLRRDHEVRRTAWMIINEKNAAKVLKTAPPLETVPALYLSATLDNAVQFGKLPREYLGKFWIDISDSGVNPILPTVKVVDGERILVDGLAYFSKEKMVGRTNALEIGAYMGMKEKSDGGYPWAVTLEGEKGIYMIKSQKRKPRIDVMVEDGVPRASIKVDVEATVDEEIVINTLSRKKLKQLEEASSRKREEVSRGLIEKTQEAGSDIWGIGARIRAKYPEYWSDKVKTDENWLDIYKEMKIDVAVQYNIPRVGMEVN